MMAVLLAWMLRGPTLFVAEVQVSTVLAASVARCESSARYDDGAAVLATALNRARLLRRSLASVLVQPWQFAWSCPASPRTWSWRHVQLGLDAALGTLRAPAWAWKALMYCGPSDSRDRCHDRREAHFEIVGEIVHTFYGRGG